MAFPKGSINSINNNWVIIPPGSDSPTILPSHGYFIGGGGTQVNLPPSPNLGDTFYFIAINTTNYSIAPAAFPQGNIYLADGTTNAVGESMVPDPGFTYASITLVCFRIEDISNLPAFAVLNNNSATFRFS